MYYQTQQVQKKPTAAYALSLISGIFGLLVSLAITGFAAYVYAMYGSYLNELAGELGVLDVASVVNGILILAIGFGVWSLVSSIVVLVSAGKLHGRPLEHTKWGVIILVFSIIGFGPLAYILSYVGVALFQIFGLDVGGALFLALGIVIGVFGFIGGILALVFKPTPTQQQPYGYSPQPQQPYAPQPQYYQPPPPAAATQPPQNITRICPNCGRVINETVKFCPYCGKALA